MIMKKLRIGITVGDPAGIGPEITRKALSKAAIKRLADYLIIDCSEKKHVLPGYPSKISGLCAINNIDTGIDLIKGKAIDALVTAPISKEMIAKSRKNFTGHTGYIAKSFNTKDYCMGFVSKNFKLSLVTTHLPLKQVSSHINFNKVLSVIKVTLSAMQNYFNLKNPKIAVCGLNPHAGEGGILGQEENKFIVPAVKRAKKLGVNIHGPIPADALFYEVFNKKFDCCIAMYHDQALIPLKMIDKFNSVNMTFGLPFVRTSPSHGTAFDIASKKCANPESMIEAIKLAAYCLKQSSK